MAGPCAKRKRTMQPIYGWEDHAARVKKQRISEDSLRDNIRRQHAQDQNAVIHVKVSLKYPSTGSRIDVPVRSMNCQHPQCFDLATYLKERDCNLVANFVTWKCPICSVSAEVHELRVDGYFEAFLRMYAELENINEVEMLSDGTYRPVVRAKVEAIPVSETPFLPPEAADNDDEKPPVKHAQDLEALRRLPETHQICKLVKQRLLNKFKRHSVSVASVAPSITASEHDHPGPSGERGRGTGKRIASPLRQKATGSKRPHAHQQMLRTISNTLGNKNEAVKSKMKMIAKLEKELAENRLGPLWAQKLGAKRVADWRRDQEQRLLKYKAQLHVAEEELVDWQKTRIAYKALHAYYRKRHEEEKFVEKFIKDRYTNPVQIVAHCWHSQSASDRKALFMQCIVEAPEAFKNHPEKIDQFKANFESPELYDTFFQLRHDIRVTVQEDTEAL